MARLTVKLTIKVKRKYGRNRPTKLTKQAKKAFIIGIEELILHDLVQCFCLLPDIKASF